MASYYRTVSKLLKKNGWSICRQPRGSHEIWHQADDQTKEITVPSNIKSRHTANSILKQAGIKIKV